MTTIVITNLKAKYVFFIGYKYLQNASGSITKHLFLNQHFYNVQISPVVYKGRVILATFFILLSYNCINSCYSPDYFFQNFAHPISF